MIEDANRWPRTRPETCIFIKVGWPGQAPPVWPNPTERDQLFSALNTLLARNSYNQASIVAAGAPAAVVTVELAANPEINQNVLLLETIKEFNSNHSERLDGDYEHVVIVTRAAEDVDLASVGQFVIFPVNQKNLPSNPGKQNATLIAEVAAAITHEMAHGYRLAHANSLQAWVKGLDADYEYGDILDPLGGMTQTRQRFSKSCWPDPQRNKPTYEEAYAELFAPATDIHFNPIHKLQQGWIPSSSIPIAPPDDTVRDYYLSGISRPIPGLHGIRAVQIQRGFFTSYLYSPLAATNPGEIPEDQKQIPQSLLVYWRDNEPRARGGVSVALVSREWMQAKTFLHELQRPATEVAATCPTSPENMACDDPLPPLKKVCTKYMPAWNVTIPIGGSWTDAGEEGASGAKIECVGLFTQPPATSKAVGAIGLAPAQPSISSEELEYEMWVRITVPDTAPVFGALPIVHIECPEIESRRVITSADTLHISASASLDGGELWVGIDRVEAVIFVSDENSARMPLVIATFRNPGGNPPQVWPVPAAEIITALRPSLLEPPVRRPIGLVVTAYAGSEVTGMPERRISASRVFLLDETQT